MSRATWYRPPYVVESRTLVIGVGSTLRRDDAAGREVAERIDRLGLAGVSVRVVTQLVPELIVEMADVDRVVFVDADVAAGSPLVRAVTREETGSLTHHGRPEHLLALAERAGFGVPEAHCVGVPVHDLGLGTGLTSRCEAGIPAAVAAVLEVVRAKVSRDPGTSP